VSDRVDELRALLGADAVTDELPARTAYSIDWTPRALLAQRRHAARELAACVVQPSTTAQVSELLRWADETVTPIVPFGGGSSVVGGIEPPAGAVVLDLTGMWRIRDLDEKARHVAVEAGVTGPQLAEALAVQGYMLGHEPQSVAISTVGGWIATRASGQLSARYGGIEARVAALEAVVPGGRVLCSRAMPRRSAGPDVASLMIGSEGTLGVITSATLRISPLPQERVDRCLRFEHMADGVAAARSITQSGLRPTLLRLYDAEDAALFLRRHPEAEQGPLMLLSFDGALAHERADVAVAASGAREGDAALVAHWWHHRNDAVHEFRALMTGEGILGPHGIADTMEVAGTWTVLRDLYHSMKDDLAAEADLAACHISHVYEDGACLYFTLAAACSSDEEAAAKLDRWWDVGMRTCLKRRGSISHHHGIGRLKAPWLADELGPWWEMLKAVKARFDPNGIMNPGALGL